MLASYPRSVRPVPDPLFPGAATLPMCKPGGVTYPVEHVPGELRPYAASLGVPAPVVAGKNDTSTQMSGAQQTRYMMDGKGVTDTNPDVIHTDA